MYAKSFKKFLMRKKFRNKNKDQAPKEETKKEPKKDLHHLLQV